MPCPYDRTVDENLAEAIAESKQRLRQAVNLRRSVRSAAESTTADQARTELLTGFLASRLGSTADAAARRSQTDLVVAAYLSRAGEPGTLQTVGMLRAAGAQVLLPSFPAGSSAEAAQWAWYEGPDKLRRGPFGIPQPTGPALSGPVLGKANVIICPALAATESGDRLGTGGGWYDRALAWSDPTAPVVVLLNDNEVLNSLPTVETDVPVDVIITEQRVITVS